MGNYINANLKRITGTRESQGQVPLTLAKLSTVSVNEGKKCRVKSGKDTYAARNNIYIIEVGDKAIKLKL